MRKNPGDVKTPNIKLSMCPTHLFDLFFSSHVYALSYMIKDIIIRRDTSFYPQKKKTKEKTVHTFTLHALNQ